MMKGSRRTSRFDPMAGDEEDGDDDGYGELGGRHPLRRVDEGKEDSGVSLPGIKALFGVAGEIVAPRNPRPIAEPSRPPANTSDVFSPTRPALLNTFSALSRSDLSILLPFHRTNVSLFLFQLVHLHNRVRPSASTPARRMVGTGL
jgi:hypothetical protein